MTSTIRAHLRITREDGRSSAAVLSRQGRHLSLEVHDPTVLVGICADQMWLSRAKHLGQHGEVLHVSHDGMHLLSLGAIKSVDEAATGSAFINLGTWSTARRMLGLSAGQLTIGSLPAAQRGKISG